jgi:hypothetical protein
MKDVVRLVRDVRLATLKSLLGRYGLTLIIQEEGEAIAGSYWGDSEAGIVGRNVYVRDDTPIHSVLHEASHIICMTNERRERLDRDAGGDDLEEASVCYLQIVLADQIGGVGSDLLKRDMDSWGYSFRLGSTSLWFDTDADDAREWLIQHGLLTDNGQPTFTLRA